MWKLEFDEGFFRIYDSKKLVAGYFDPDYGDIHPKENSEKIITDMVENHEPISGGFLMVPMVKFGLFDTDLNINLDTLISEIHRVDSHLKKWEIFLTTIGNTQHSIRISHTDQDMLTIAFPLKFSRSTPLEKNALINQISPTLDLLQNSNLL